MGMVALGVMAETSAMVVPVVSAAMALQGLAARTARIRVIPAPMGQTAAPVAGVALAARAVHKAETVVPAA